MATDQNNTYKYYDIIYQEWMPVNKTNSELSLFKQFIDKTSQILDIGCGSGRHLIPLHQDGYRVEGIDFQSQAISLLKQKDPTTHASVGDIFNIPTHNQYNLVYMMWNAFSEIATTREQVHKLLNKIHSILQGGGHFIFDLNNEPEDYSTWSFKHSVTQNGETYKLDWDVVTYNKATKTTASSEHIRVYDQKGNMLDDVTATVKQRWWTIDEIKLLIDSKNYTLTSQLIPDSTYLYCILTKK